MSEPLPDVHPWTVGWYDTLPESYRTLDRQQKNSLPVLWDALTKDPTFFYGWGEWTVTAPLQTLDEIMVSMTQRFRSVAGEPVYTQIFWAAPAIEGTLVQLSVIDAAGTILDEVTVEPTLGVAGEAELQFYSDSDGYFTVRILILVPAPADNLLDILAINVGLKRVESANLPSGGYIQPNSHPLLRFMDGIGQIGGGFRNISDNLWDGTYADPATVPEPALKWLAQMMGVSTNLRGQLDNTQLRAHMVDVATNGRIGAGTLTSLREAARAFLTGERMVDVVKHETIDHTLVILVRAAEVPGGNLQGIIDTVRSAGVMPAGHDLMAREAIASWDEFEAGAGATWTELETAAPTWVRADSIGINLEG